MEKKKKSFDIKEKSQKTVNRRNEKSKSCNLGLDKLHLLPIINSSTVEFQNSKHRQTMEDKCYSCLNYMGENSKKLFAVFDGHGGDACVILSAERFPDIFSKYIRELGSNIDYCLKQSFASLDKESKEKCCYSNGCTLTCIFISNKMLYCANVGDSSCLLVTNNSAYKISYDHTCIDESEIKRVISAGGKIFEERVDGIIAISRTIGDHELKGKGLISDPYLYKHGIGENDKYVIIASDGVWDVINESDIYKVCKDKKEPEMIAKKILQDSIDNGTTDNVSCIVISINKGFN